MKAFQTRSRSLVIGLTTPSEYLEYARRALLDEGPGSEENGLSNIKRAIDSQLDILLDYFSLLRISNRKRWNFPKKIDILQNIGVTTPTILKLINKKRNEMEHEFKKPERENVLEYLGIDELFIELFKSWKEVIEIIIDYDNNYALWVDQESEIIRIYDNTKYILESGGVEVFGENGKYKTKYLIDEIKIKNLDSWLDVCSRYLVNFYKRNCSE